MKCESHKTHAHVREENARERRTFREKKQNNCKNSYTWITRYLYSESNDLLCFYFYSVFYLSLSRSLLDAWMVPLLVLNMRNT